VCGVNSLAGKWTAQILWAMKDKPVRLRDLMRTHPSASQKALTASLRSLESSQIILRKDLSTSVLHVEYELTESMRQPVIELLCRLAEWGGLL
jgi:DNA-binding HxlR family transcriptional regulator